MLPKVFAGPHFTAEDDRLEYDETRYITAGLLDGRMVILVWTPRDGQQAHHLDEEGQ